MPASKEISRERLEEMVARGLSYRAMAKECEVHHSTVKRWATIHGVTPARPRGVPPQPVDAEHSECSKCPATDIGWTRIDIATALTR